MSSLNAPYSSGDSGETFLTEINADLLALNTDKAEIAGQVFTGKVAFSGTTHAGLQLLSLTTTERDALTPVNGDVIYNETTSKVQMYQGDSWTDVTSVASDASTTVKGVVEIATDAEIEAGTGTGGTGAKIVVGADSSHLPDDNEMAALAGTSGTPSGSNKFVTNDDTSATPAASEVIRATSGKLDSAYVGGDLTDGSNADSLHEHATLSTFTMATGTIQIIGADTEAVTASTTYTVKKDIDIGIYNGTLSVGFDIKTASASTDYFGRIYVNGIAVGTERTGEQTAYQTFTEDISGLVAGDNVQLYVHGESGGGGHDITVRNFRIYAAQPVEPKVVTD